MEGSKFHIKDGVWVCRPDDNILLYKQDGLDVASFELIVSMTPSEFASMVAAVTPAGHDATFRQLHYMLGV